MKTQIRIFVFLLCFSVYNSIAQKRTADSLETILKTHPDDTNKILIINSLINSSFAVGEYNKIDSLLRIVFALSEKLNFAKGKFIYYMDQGRTSEMSGQYTGAINNYMKALEIAEELKNIPSMSSVYNNLGIIHFTQGDLANAYNNYIKGVNLIKPYGKSIALANFYNNIGNVYYSKHLLDTALQFYHLSLEIRESINDKKGVSNSLNNIGDIYMNMNKDDEALDYFLKAQKIQEELSDKYNLAYSFLNEGIVYKKKKNYKAAEAAFLKGYQLAETYNYPEIVRDGASVLNSFYETTGDVRSAYFYFKIFIKQRDSLANNSHLKELIQQETKHEYLKKEIILKSMQEKENISYNEKSKQQKIIIASVSAVLLLLLVFSFFLYDRFKLTKHQHAIITHKNKEIIDSINYAKRLQNAILLPEQELSKYFPEIFVLFKPKDIVSGDFYWFSESAANKIIAVADCTGHGVPGGFMSMLGYESLQDVALRENITTTADALKSLDKKITDTLNKSDRTFRDGMDIALCAFSKTENTLQYSGAHRPLIHISNGVLTEYKPDKNTIGGDIDGADKKYSTQKISYKKGDLFYLFTDGFPDQFGGEAVRLPRSLSVDTFGQGKKFKYKNLQKALLSISALPLKEQKISLDKTFEDWKGSLEQLDDVCIIGIQL